MEQSQEMMHQRNEVAGLRIVRREIIAAVARDALQLGRTAEEGGINASFATRFTASLSRASSSHLNSCSRKLQWRSSSQNGSLKASFSGPVSRR